MLKKFLLMSAMTGTFMATNASIVAGQEAAATSEPAAESSADEPWLKVYFASGSSSIGADQADTLDRAARTFREGDPFVMIVSGSADTVGAPASNLDLSLRRATSVAKALSSRGIPIERLQVLGRGNSELEVTTGPGIPEAENRVVEISWQ